MPAAICLSSSLTMVMRMVQPLRPKRSTSARAQNIYHAPVPNNLHAYRQLPRVTCLMVSGSVSGVERR